MMLEFREIFLQPVLNIRMRMHTAGTEQVGVYRIEESDHIDPFHDLRFEVFADGDDLSIDHKGVILDVFDLFKVDDKGSVDLHERAVGHFTFNGFECAEREVIFSRRKIFDVVAHAFDI